MDLLNDPTVAASLARTVASQAKREMQPLQVLTDAAKLRQMISAAEAEAATYARATGWTWEQIGQAAGVTRQSAHEKWTIGVRPGV